MLAWSEGTDNGRQTRNHGYDVIVGGELFTDYSDVLSQTCHAKPKRKSTGAGRYSFFPVGGMPTTGNGWKTSLRKVRTLWHCGRLRSVALYLWLIVVISVRQSTVAAISGLHCRALVMVGSSIRLTAWLQKIQRSGRNSPEEIDARAESPRLSPLWLSASSSALHGLLIITVITPAPTKPSATKMPENWSCVTNAAAIADMQMRQRECLLRSDAKMHEGLADAKAENDALRDDYALVVVGCTSKRSMIQCVKPPPPPAYVQPPRLADTAERVISPAERGWSLCNNWKEPRSILMSSADRVAHLMGNSCNYCEQYTRASSGV